MIESPLPYVSHKTAPFRAPVLCGNRSSGVQPISVNRQSSTVNRVLAPCSGVIGNSLLLVCHTERRPQSPYVGTGAQPLSVNRQPCLSVSLDCSQQLIQNCIRAWSFLNDLMIQHQILETLCVFKWSKCFNRQCRHPSFDHRDISEVMQIYCSHSVQVG